MNTSPPADVPALPPILYGGTGNRTVAFLIDAILLGFLASFVSGFDPSGRFAIPLLAWVYLAGVPLSPLQGTPGQWVCRIRLCDRQGNRVTWRTSALRATLIVGWFCLPVAFNALHAHGAISFGKVLTHVWWLLFLTPWASIGFRPRRESVFDLLAGTLVVTTKADPEQIANDQAPRNLRLFSGMGTLLLCLAVGAVFQAMLDMVTVRALHARTTYAVQETRPLRAQIEEFHLEKHRWPTPAELGTSASFAYPDGGHYRLEPEGKIVIQFSVKPELKDRSLIFTPMFIPKEGRFNWECKADDQLDKRFLPSACR